MNPNTGALYHLPVREGEALTRLDDGPPEPVSPRRDDLAPVTICTARHRSGVHVVDEDSPEATLCGREVANLLQHMPERKYARPCRECQDQLAGLVAAGEWTGPADA